jgi:formyltetrahydrofolate synthetase
MPAIKLETIEKAKQELNDFIEDNFEYLDVLIAQSPRSFSIRSMSEAQDAAWTIGFGRCLAELKRIAGAERR